MQELTGGIEATYNIQMVVDENDCGWSYGSIRQGGPEKQVMGTLKICCCMNKNPSSL